MKKQLTSITGRLGKDPVLYMRETKNGQKPVAKFSLAVTVLGDNQDKEGRREAETVWWQVSAWDKRANVCARNLKKGDAVQLHGFCSQGSYTNKRGEKVTTLEFNCIFVTFLTKKTELPAWQHSASAQETFRGDAEDDIPF